MFALTSDATGGTTTEKGEKTAHTWNSHVKRGHCQSWNNVVIRGLEKQILLSIM